MKQSMNTQAAKGHRLFYAAMALVALVVAPLSAGAQEDGNYEEWPTETIEVVSHSSAGGGTDTTIRMWLPAAKKLVDEDMVVVYKLGGGARAAHEYLAGLDTDGIRHAIFALTPTHLYTIARGRSPIQMEDIQGVARAMSDPSVIVVRADSPIGSYKELVEKSQDQALVWGVAQVGGTEHIGIARWAEQSGAETRIVPFGGGGSMVTALRSGAVDATLANLSESLTLITEGELKALAILAPERSEDLPDVPSTYEFGHDVTVATTRGYFVSADVPPAIVDQMEDLILSAMDSKRFQDYLRSIGVNPETSIAGAEVWDKQMNEMYDVALKTMRKLGMTDK